MPVPTKELRVFWLTISNQEFLALCSLQNTNPKSSSEPLLWHWETKLFPSFNLHMRGILIILQLFNEINIFLFCFFPSSITVFSFPKMLLVLEPVNVYHLHTDVAAPILVVTSCNSRWDSQDFSKWEKECVFI